MPKLKLLAPLVLAISLWTQPLIGVESITSAPPLPTLQISATQKARELECLAKNIYFESRGEPFHGKLAVAQVTINRVLHSSQFKSTICGVVYENKQFSWTLKKNAEIRDKKAWAEAVTIAHAVVYGTAKLVNFPALYFHTKEVKPYWKNSRVLVKVIGNHIFYA